MGQPHENRPLPGGRELIAIAEADARFKVRRRHGLAALNYVYVTNDEDQFHWPRSEMRGLIVDEQTGEVIARPFQKFWSITEKQAGGTDWSERHLVLPKLDGSLVYPAGDRWVTRGGVTDTSERAEALARSIGKPLDELVRRVRTDPADTAACTPCFEYIGPDNRIVVPYDTPRLILLAVRRISDGRYWPWERLRSAFETSEQASGTNPGIGLVAPLTTAATQLRGRREYARELADEIAAWKGDANEGVVVAFEESGHRVKIKSREYIALHRARDDYSSESRVLKVWSDGNAKALLERLSADRRRRLEGYYGEIEQRIAGIAEETATVATRIWHACYGDRKRAAAQWMTATAARGAVRPIGFSCFDALKRGEDPQAKATDQIRRAIARGCNRQTLIEQKVRPMLGPDMPAWRPPDGNNKDTEQ